MRVSPRFGVKFVVTFFLAFGRCGSTVRAVFPRKELIMRTYAKTVFFGTLSLVGLLALPPLAKAQDAYQGQSDGREYHSEEKLRSRDRRSFETYLDTHWETAQLLYQQPELINDHEFLHDHRALRDWLAEHKRAARVIQANPRQVLWEQRGSQPQPDGTVSPAELSSRDRRSFDAYLDTHWETAQLLYQQPELINDRQFVSDHRALRDWLAEHKKAARVIQANPSQVLWERRSSQLQSDLSDSRGSELASSMHEHGTTPS
jgi:hypothetical protein